MAVPDMWKSQQTAPARPAGRRSPPKPGHAALIALATVLMTLRPTGLAADGPALTITDTAAATTITLSMAEIQALGRSEIETTTPWTDGVQHFAGVTGASLIKAVHARAGDATAIAVNNYQVVIPFAVLDSESTLIAYERNGKPMTVRDKGPLWIVFPFDTDAKYVTETYKSYAIWSLIRVEFH